MNKFKSPVYNVIGVPLEKMRANSWNPNTVASPEMALLELSIWEDGYTMPVVCYYVEEDDVYEIVDGFHRYTVLKTSTRIRNRENGILPVVVIEKDISNRMASTIRHNRARGKHQVEAMTNIVLDLKRRNWSSEKIGKQLGMDPDEVLRLTQIGGLADAFLDKEFSEAWEPTGTINEDDNIVVEDENA